MHPFRGTRLSINIFYFEKNYLTTPIAHQIVRWDDYYYLIPIVDGETRTTLLSVCFVWFRPKIYYVLFYLSLFCFILVHTQVIQANYYYIIIYTTKKHYFTWTYILNSLIGLL